MHKTTTDLLIRHVEKTDVVSHIHMSFAVYPPLCHVAVLEDSIHVKTLFVAKDNQEQPKQLSKRKKH